MSSHFKEVVIGVLSDKGLSKLNSGQISRIRAAERDLDNKKVEIDEALASVVKEFRLDRHDIEAIKRRVN